MNQEIKNKTINSKLEWGCRIMLSVCAIRLLSGYIIFIQTYRQLVTPLIPKSITYEISIWYIQASLISGLIFIVALWAYFFRKIIPCLILSGVSLLAYEILVMYLPKLVI